MPVSDTAAPAHRVQPGRSWPSHADSRLTVIGVHPKISALLLADVRATPPMNRYW